MLWKGYTYTYSSASNDTSSRPCRYQSITHPNVSATAHMRPQGPRAAPPDGGRRQQSIYLHHMHRHRLESVTTNTGGAGSRNKSAPPPPKKKQSVGRPCRPVGPGPYTPNQAPIIYTPNHIPIIPGQHYRTGRPDPTGDLSMQHDRANVR